MADDDNGGGWLQGLQRGFSNPMTLGGLGLLTGGGMGAMAQGVNAGMGMQKWDKENAQLDAQNKAFQQLQQNPDAYKGLPPAMGQMINAMGPQGIPYAVQMFMKNRDNDQQFGLFAKQHQYASDLEWQKMQGAKELDLQQMNNKLKMIQGLFGMNGGSFGAPSPAPGVRTWTPNGGLQ